MQIITIIGGGPAGISLAIHLLNSKSSFKIILVDKHKTGRIGSLYSGSFPGRLMHHPVSQLSVFPQDQNHFSDWLSEKNIEHVNSDFVPQAFYADYLTETLEESKRQKVGSILFERISDEVIDVNPAESGFLVTLEKGHTFYSDKVILAAGKIFEPIATNIFKDGNYILDPLNNTLLPKCRNEKILIIGSGRNAAEAVSVLYCNEFKGEITMLSATGNYPVPYLPEVVDYPDSKIEELRKRGLLQGFSWLNKRIKMSKDIRFPLCSIINSMKDELQHKLYHLTIKDKVTFNSHLKKYADLVFNQMPFPYLIGISKLAARGKLKLLKGRVTKIKRNNEWLECDLKYYNSGLQTRQKFDLVLDTVNHGNCSLLAQGLASQKLATYNKLMNQLEVDEDFQMVKTQEGIKGIFAIGNIRNSSYNIKNELPDVLQQSVRMAEYLTAQGVLTS